MSRKRRSKPRTKREGIGISDTIPCKTCSKPKEEELKVIYNVKFYIRKRAEEPVKKDRKFVDKFIKKHNAKVDYDEDFVVSINIEKPLPESFNQKELSDLKKELEDYSGDTYLAIEGKSSEELENMTKNELFSYYQLRKRQKNELRTFDEFYSDIRFNYHMRTDDFEAPCFYVTRKLYKQKRRNF